jgi:LruC domain-containing protein
MLKTVFKGRLIQIGFLSMISIFLLFAEGCKKEVKVDDSLPTKFTELKVASTFEFESFKNVEATITVPALKGAAQSIVQIYQGNPAEGGKLIMTGSLDANNQFKSPVRIPTRLTDVYIARLTSSGENAYVAVPITGNTVTYDFGKGGVAQKSTGSSNSNDCTTGCTSTVSGTQSNLTINAGQMVCVNAGTNATFSSLKINTGGTLRICGTATVNSYNSTGGDGKIIVTPTGTLTLPKYNTYFTIENYGSLNWSGSSTTSLNGNLHNWGTVNSTIKFTNQGTIINDGSFTVTDYFINNTASFFTNNCSFYATSTSNNSWSNNGTFTNNGFVRVSGTANVSGGKVLNLGLQSLFETKSFSLQGNVNGPSAQGSQIHATGTSSSSISAGCTVTGYVDFWASSINPSNGNYGSHVTFHNPGYTIPVPTCNMPTAPVITSSLVAGGLVNQAITPYVITATGTEPITYNATGLPPGLTYNASTHTISGTPTTAGTYNVILTADNYMGTSTKTLVFTITQPAAPPVITSNLTASTTVNQPYTYTITASGTGPITYNATNLPAGLSYNTGTNQITGTPTTPGTYNITLTATNAGGTDTKTLVLTVGAPPLITSSLTASGIAGTQFSTYTLTASGSGPITYTAVNLPDGLNFNPINQTINGTPNNAGVTSVTMTATNAYGSDVKVLVITIIAGTQPPVITSSLVAAGEKNQPFSYAITATGTDPIVFNATSLPPGLSYSNGIISGIPTATGTFNIPLTATNIAGVDNKTLVLTIVAQGSTTDTDGDGVMDNLDAYPTDPTRAFNSYYPNEVDYGSYAFEDLWPAYGDYDCNDLVMNFNYKIVTNAQNKVVDLILKCQIMAAGASLNNGFGISLNTPPGNVESITGCIKLGNAINIDPKGFEIGHTDNTVFFPVDAVNTMLGNGMVNTSHGGNTVQTSVQTVTVHFSTPPASIGTPPYNPFIFVDQERGHEVHLKDKPPTVLVDPAYFGTENDASNPAQGFYYRSTSGLTWAVEVPSSFNWPLESKDILTAYLHFAEWAQSSGSLYPDWYMNKPGYRNPQNIY